MSVEMDACKKAKAFIEYVEAFSFANQLTGSVEKEKMTINYTASFGVCLLNVEVSFIDGNDLKIKVLWTNKTFKKKIQSNKWREKFDSIKDLLNFQDCSCNIMLENMLFILDDLGEFNILLDLLTEGS